jgi:uncharacterized repeat protein (TIGR01451 family)
VGARRLVLALLALVVLAATPAGAQEFDFTAVPKITIGLTNQGAVCSSSTVVFGPTGGVLGGSTVSCDGTLAFPINSGSLSVNNTTGDVTGFIGGDFISGELLPEGFGFVAATTFNASVFNGFGLTAFVENNGTVFTQGNLTGTWRFKFLQAAALPATTVETAFGSVVIGGNGSVTGGSLSFSDLSTETFTGGSLILDSSGSIAGAVLTNVGNVTGLLAFMAPDRNFIAGITQLDDGSANKSGMFFLQRSPTVTYTPSNLAGGWDLVALQGNVDDSTQGRWFRGNVSFNSTGVITSGTLVDSLANVVPVSSGAFTMDSQGFISGSAVLGDGSTISTQATMFQDKKQIIGVDRFTGVTTPDTLGLYSMFKQTPPPPASSVQFNAATTHVTEGGTATIQVNRSGATSTTVMVNYAVTAGTATAGGDFDVATGTLSFPAGSTKQTFTVPTFQNTTATPTGRTVLLALSNPTNGAAVGPQGTATLVIDDDESTVQFDRPQYFTPEGTAGVITLTRTGAVKNPATVLFNVSGITAVPGVDFTSPVANTVSFAANQATKTFSIATLDNTRLDGNRSVLLTLLPASTNSSTVAVIGANSSAVLTITDNDDAGVAFLNSGAFTVAEGAGGVTVNIMRKLSRAGLHLTGNVSVSYATVNGNASAGSDFTATSGAVTFTSPSDVGPKPVTIPIRQDTSVEGTEPFSFVLSNPTNGLVLGTPSTATVSITDDDKGGTVFLSQKAYSVVEGGGNVSVTVLRSGGAANVSVDFTTSDGTATAGSDYTAVTTTVVFGAGETSKKVVIPITQDLVAEGDETFTVTLSNPQGGAALGQPASATVTILDDESLVQFTSGSFAVVEGGTAGVTLSRAGALFTTVTVPVNVSGITAVPGVDFTTLSAIATFPVNAKLATVQILTKDNTILDGSRTALLTLGPPTGGAQLGANASATLTITDNEDAGLLALDKSAYSGAEGQTVTIGITRKASRPGTHLVGNVSVGYATVNGNASAGSNFNAAAGSVTFGIGDTATKLVPVTLRRNTLVEGTKVFTFALSGPTNGGALGTPSSAPVSITDDDKGGIVFLSAKTYSVAEGAGNVSITVTRSGGAANVSVTFTTSDDTATAGSDYIGTNTSVVFGAGETSKKVVIPIIQDTLAEGAETFTVTLSNPQGGATLGQPASATVTILDDESLVQLTSTAFSTQEGAPGVITLARTGALFNTVTVPVNVSGITAVPGVDFTTLSAIATFPVNAKLATVQILTRDNTILDGSRTALLTLGPPTGGAQLGANASAVLTITDNEDAGIVTLSSPSYSVSEAQPQAFVTVLRKPSRPGANLVGNVSVSYTSMNGNASAFSDYTPVGGTITFGPGDVTPRILNVPILQDQLNEGTEFFTFALINPTGGLTLGTPSSAPVYILDDDQGHLVFLSQKAYSVGEGAGNISITVMRAGGTAGNVSVHFATSDGTATAGSDYTAVSTTVVFGPNETAKTVVVPILQDTLAEGDEFFTVILSNPQGGPKLGVPASAPVTIVDDETIIQFTGGAVGNEPIVVRTGSLLANVSVQYQVVSGTATLGSDFILAPGTLVFPPGVSTRTIPLVIVNDNIAEGPETLTINLFNPSPPAQLGPMASLHITITDNDFGGDVGFGSASLTAARGETKQLEIVRAGGIGTVLTVGISIVGGTAAPGVDFSLGNTSVTFMPTESVKLVPVQALPTMAFPPDRTVTFGVTFPPGAAALGPVSTSTLTILGPPAVIQFSAPTYAVAESDESAPITVVRGGNTNSSVTVQYATGNGNASAGSDYGPTSGTLTFGPGQTALTFFVPIVADAIVEGPETVNLTLSNVSVDGVLGPQATAVLTITDAPAVGTLELISKSTGGLVGNGESQGPAVDGDGLRVAFTSAATNFGGGGAGTTVYLRDRGANTTTAISVDTLGGPEDGNSNAPSISADGRFVAFVSTSTNLVAMDSNNASDVFVRDVVTAVIERVSLGAGGTELDGDSLEPAISADGNFVAFTSLAPNLVPSGSTSGVFVFDRTLASTALVSLNASSLPMLAAGSAALSGDGRFVAFVGTDDPPGSGSQVYIRDLWLGFTEQVSLASDGTPADGSIVGAPSVGGDGRLVAFASTATNLGDPSGTSQVYVHDRQTGLTELASKSPAGVPASSGSSGPRLSGDGRFLVFTSSGGNLGPADANGFADVYARDLQTGVTQRLSVSGTVEPNAGSQAVSIGANGTFVAFHTAANNLAPGDSNAVLDVVGRPLAFAAAPTSADIAITNVVNVANPAVGTPAVFTITATNHGPGAATGVQVTDLLPVGLAFVSSQVSQGVYDSEGGIWTVGSLTALGSGAIATLQITAVVQPVGPYTNTATRTASSPTDPTAANDSASATVTPAAISLSTAGPLVGLGRMISGTVTLPGPAAGQVDVALATGPPGIVSVAPVTVSIPSGQSSGPFTVTGVAVGTATITGTATGYATGNVSVTTTSSVISLGALPTLGPGQTLSLPISLSTPAPTGGVTVSFTSANSSIATVTPSVVIPGGSQVPAANPQVTGVLVGMTTIGASATGFAPDTRNASVVVSVTFTPSPFSVVVGTSSNISVNLSAPAPSGGFTLSLATANSSVATVASPVTVPAGQTSVPAAVTGAAIASTTLQASGAGVTSATVTVNVTAPPPITISSDTIGKDLQSQRFVSLGAAAPAGGLPVTLTSGDATKVRLSAVRTTLGNGSLVLSVPAGSFSSAVYYVQALDSTGTVTLTASAPGYSNGSATVTLMPAGFIISNGGIFSTTTLSGNTSVQVALGRLTAGTLTFAAFQELRGGTGPVDVPVTATDQAGGPGVGTVTSPVSFSSGDTFKLTSFDPLVAGISLVQVGTPAGFNTSANSTTITATVSAPRIFLNNQTIGKDLQLQTSLSLEAPAPLGGLSVTLTSADPARLLLSTSQMAAGNDSVTLSINQGSSFANVYLQALDSAGTVTVSGAAPGFQNVSATVTLAPAGFIINSPGSFSTTTLSSNTSVSIALGQLNPATLAFTAFQQLRAGIGPVSVPVTATDQTGGPGVGAITSPVTFSSGDTFKNTPFAPAAAGTSLLQIATPAGFNTSSNFTSITATVTAPGLFVNGPTIGKDLQQAASVSLGAAAPMGGLPVTLTSADPIKVLLSASQTVAGNGSITLNVAQGSFFGNFYVQALDSTGTVTFTATAPGFQNASTTVTLAPSGFLVSPSGALTTTTFSANTSIQVLATRLTPGSLTASTFQEVRAGAGPLNVAVTATDQTGGPGVGAISISPLVFDGGDISKFTAFDPAAAGTSLVEVVQPAGFTPPTGGTLAFTVAAPTISFSTTNVQVGRDLQQVVNVFLQAPPPSPVTVTVTVASTAVATITTDGTLAGGTTVTFTNVTSTFAGSLFVQGRVSSGTTSLTVQAPGYADGVVPVTAQPSGFIINTGDFATTAGAGNTTIQILSAALNPATLNAQFFQAVRGGLSVNVPVTAADLTGGPGVGTITTSPLTFTNSTVSLFTQFDPAVVGTSQITVGVPAGFDTPSTSRQITVTVNP